LETSSQPGFPTSFQLVRLVGCGLNGRTNGWMDVRNRGNKIALCIASHPVVWQNDIIYISLRAIPFADQVLPLDKIYNINCVSSYIQTRKRITRFLRDSKASLLIHKLVPAKG